jgi:hypothetical protein
MSTQHHSTAAADRTAQVNRWLIVALLAMVAFFATYRYAEARSAASPTATPAAAVAGAPVAGQPGAGAAGQAAGGCCGGGGTAGPAVSKQADVSGGVQKITVDLSSGSYNPNQIVFKAGLPAQITFGQGSGCLSYVQSQDLSFAEDLTGGPKTVQIPALKAGTYSFTCGMGMVSGSVVVK